MLDLRRLWIFTAVAEEGSLTGAAQRLYLTQSAVSQQMSLLEREIGVPLLIRIARGIQLTAAGTLLAREARSLLTSASALERQLALYRGGDIEVRLGGFSTAGAELIPLAVRTFRELHPDVRIELSPSHPNDAVAQLRSGQVHVCVVWDYDFAPLPLEPDVARLHLLDDPLRVVLPAGHPLADSPSVALAELADEPWVIRAHRPPYASAYETMCRIAGFEPRVAFRTEDYQSIQGLVAAGVGVSVVPQLSLIPQRADIVSVPLRTPAFSRRVAALTPADGAQSPAVIALQDILRKTAEELGPELH